MSPRITAHAYRHPFSRHVELLLEAPAEAGQRAVCQELRFTPVAPDAYIGHGTATLDATAAQVLMDSLWDAGIRPTAGTGSAGAMQAVQEHLADMRRIAFAHPLFDRLEVTARPSLPRMEFPDADS